MSRHQLVTLRVLHSFTGQLQCSHRVLTLREVNSIDACHITLLDQLLGTHLPCHCLTLVTLLLVHGHLRHQQLFYKAAPLPLLSMHLHLGLVGRQSPIQRGRMHMRGCAKWSRSFAILSHNINSINSAKLRNCMDVIAELDEHATPILCLQETKL